MKPIALYVFCVLACACTAIKRTYTVVEAPIASFCEDIEYLYPLILRETQLLPLSGIDDDDYLAIFRPDRVKMGIHPFLAAPWANIQSEALGYDQVSSQHLIDSMRNYHGHFSSPSKIVLVSCHTAAQTLQETPYQVSYWYEPSHDLYSVILEKRSTRNEYFAGGSLPIYPRGKGIHPITFSRLAGMNKSNAL